jgi:membrane dipeptidase
MKGAHVLKTGPKREEKNLSRREVLKTIAGASLGAIAAPMVNRGRYKLFASSADEYSARAIDLVKRSIVIDMLSPLTLNFPKQAKWFSNPDSFTAEDLKRFKDSAINACGTAL